MNEIKPLLEKLLEKIERYEQRLAELEKKTHDQITLEDYYKKYGVLPGQTLPLPMTPTWPPWNCGTPALPLDYRNITIC